MSKVKTERKRIDDLCTDKSDKKKIDNVYDEKLNNMDNRIEINNNRINKLKKNMKIIFDRFDAIEKNQPTIQNMMNKFEFQINELKKDIKNNNS